MPIFEQLLFLYPINNIQDVPPGKKPRRLMKNNKFVNKPEKGTKMVRPSKTLNLFFMQIKLIYVINTFI